MTVEGGGVEGWLTRGGELSPRKPRPGPQDNTGDNTGAVIVLAPQGSSLVGVNM